MESAAAASSFAIPGLWLSSASTVSKCEPADACDGRKRVVSGHSRQRKPHNQHRGNAAKGRARTRLLRAHEQQRSVPHLVGQRVVGPKAQQQLHNLPAPRSICQTSPSPRRPTHARARAPARRRGKGGSGRWGCNGLHRLAPACEGCVQTRAQVQDKGVQALDTGRVWGVQNVGQDTGCNSASAHLSVSVLCRDVQGGPGPPNVGVDVQLVLQCSQHLSHNQRVDMSVD